MGSDSRLVKYGFVQLRGQQISYQISNEMQYMQSLLKTKEREQQVPCLHIFQPCIRESDPSDSVTCSRARAISPTGDMKCIMHAKKKQQLIG